MSNHFPTAATALLPGAALLLGGCLGATDPALSGGQRVPGTELAICPNDTGFFLSPDGRWLVFEIGDASDPGYVAFASPRFAVLDVVKAEVREVVVAEDVLALAGEQEGPLAARACWDADGRRLVMPGPGRGSWFAIDAGSPAPGLAAAQSPACAAEGEGDDPAAGVIRIERRSPRRVEITSRAGGEVLAAHEAEGAGSTRIDVGRLRLSPDGRYASYVVTERQGSFASPSRAFVLDLAAPRPDRPRLLAAPVLGSPLWSPQSVLYACTGGRGDSTPRIVRWSPEAFDRQPS